KPTDKGKSKDPLPLTDFGIFLSRDDTLDPEIADLETASATNKADAVEYTENSEEGVIPTLPASRLTPKPVQGFPKIYGTSLKKLAGHITKDTKEVWNTLTGPLVLVTVAYAKPAKEFSMTYIAKLTSSIVAVIGKSEELIVSPSELVTTKHPTLPQPFILAGLQQHQADAMTDQQCWSTPELTFFAWSTNIPVSTYLMTLAGIPIPATPENEAYVAELVRKRLLANSDFNAWVMADSNRDNIPDRIPIERSAEFVASTITASALEVLENGEVSVVWRMHMFPPSNNHDVMDDLINWLKTKTYYPSLKGIARPKRADYRCIVCRGCDHPTGLCPFRQVPGFFDNDQNSDKMANLPQGTSTPSTFSFSDIAPNNNRSRSVDPQPSSGPSNYGGRGYARRGGRGRGSRGRGRGGYYRNSEWNEPSYDEYEEW
ncbi:hypothetical protein EST38_g14662, partial [Candolleomyces aberdarensis]